MKTRTDVRDLLAGRAGRRLIYVARLKTYGVRHLKGEHRKRRGTALMKPLLGQEHSPLADHVWVTYAEPFVLAGVERGQWVRFSAVATAYTKGYAEGLQQTSYALEDVSNVEILDREFLDTDFLEGSSYGKPAGPDTP